MKKKALAVGCIAFVLGVLIGAGWLFWYFWAPMLFWGYVGIAAFVLALNLGSGLWTWRRRNPLDPKALETEIVRAQFSGPALQRSRITMLLTLSNLAEALAWPAMLASVAFAGLKHRIYRERVGSLAFLARIKLNPPITVFSVATAALVAVIFIADKTLPDTYGYRHTVLFILALSVVLKHLGAFVSEQSISKMLRSSLGEPYLKFVAIGVADLVSLLLAFAGYYAASAGEYAGINRLFGVAVDMFTFATLRSALAGGSMTWFDGFVALAGALYIANGFKSVVKYQDFQRTSEDLHAIAASELASGNHREARQWLDKVTRPESQTYELSACIYLAAGDLENAEHAAVSFAEEKKIPTIARRSEVSRLLMMNVAMLSIPEGQLMRYITHWASSQSSSPYLPAVLELILRLERLGAEDLLDAFTADETKKRHALAYAVVLLNAELDAEVLVREYTPPTPAEQYVRFSLLYRCMWRNMVNHVSSSTFGALQQWVDESIEEMRECAKKLYTGHERLLALEATYNLCDLAAALHLPHARELDGLADSLRADIGGDDRILFGLRALDGARIGVQTHLRERLAANPEIALQLRTCLAAATPENA
jgi:hypothetical protein